MGGRVIQSTLSMGCNSFRIALGLTEGWGLGVPNPSNSLCHVEALVAIGAEHVLLLPS